MMFILITTKNNQQMNEIVLVKNIMIYKCLLRFYRPQAVVIDVTAFTGGFTILMLTLIFQ